MKGAAALPECVQVSDRWHLWHGLAEAAAKEVAAHSACWAEGAPLQEGTRAHFMKFLEREFPDRLPRFEKLYVKKYTPAEYRKQVQGMVRALQNRQGLSARGHERERDRDRPVGPDPSEATQVGFRFS